jgi:hypothetical protein
LASNEQEAPAELPAAVCGAERWPVKVLTDPDADKVRIDSPQRATIAELQAMTAGTYSQTNPRLAAEEQAFTVEAWLAGYNFVSGDSDVHAVIRDDAGRTMIIEFPHADCMLGSRVLKQATEAKAKFQRLVHAPLTTRYTPTRRIRVRVTGVLYFDRLHGQVGLAPNGVELHPVLDIEAVP